MKLTDAARALNMSANEVLQALVEGKLSVDGEDVDRQITEGKKLELERALAETNAEYDRTAARIEELQQSLTKLWYAAKSLDSQIKELDNPGVLQDREETDR